MTTILYQTRLTERPYHKNWGKSLSQAQEGVWESVGVDYMPVLHGRTPHVYDSGLLRGKTPHINMIGKTDGRYGPLRANLAELAIRKGYELIGFMDDDAFCPDPALLLERVRYVFKKPHAGVVGPLYGPRFHWRVLQGERRTPSLGFEMRRVDHRPWATFGLQVFRANALRAIDYRRICSMTKQRTDVQLFMALWTKGWIAYEVECAFNHACSGMLDRAKADRTFWEERIGTAEMDHAVSVQYFARYPTIVRDLHAIRRTEVKKFQRKIEQLTKKGK